MKTAIISVFNKNLICNLVEYLLQSNYQILTTGGTYKLLKQQFTSNNNIMSIEEYTKSPEMLKGRVKTLHPKIHGGILATDTSEDLQDLQKLNIKKIDLVVCNLYPFKDVISKEHEYMDAIENIDIGGVTLIRAAFKNYHHVTILTDPHDYVNFINNTDHIDNRKTYALKAMEHIADYDTNIVNYFNNDTIYRKFQNQSMLKYGCNPHQNNSFVCKLEKTPYPFTILNGKPGYINYMDAIQSWCLVTELSNVIKKTCAASFKHTTPAGVGTSKKISKIYNNIYNIHTETLNDVSTAFIRARTADPLSSFGDFIAISDVVDEETAMLIKREVSDGIIALDYSDAALKILKEKKKGNYIILKGNARIIENLNGNEYKELNGIGLTQTINNKITDISFFNNVPTKNKNITDAEIEDMIIANTTLKYTPSNSIAFACDGQIIGVGAGQQNRVDCVKLAGNKALKWCLTTHSKTLNIMNMFKPELKRQDRVNATMQFLQFNKNSDSDIDNILINKWKNQNISEENDIEPHKYFINSQDTQEHIHNFNISMASDAFFPFSDNIDYAYKFGVKNILQPGGSIADENIIKSCDDYNMYMAMSGVRIFTH